jgi:hypothetical protein
MVLILTCLRWHLGAAFTRLAFVIPGRGRLPASPESIFADLWIWIPDSPPSKSAVADLDIELPMSGKPDIGVDPE